MGGLAVEIFLSHLGGAFHRWQMWIPTIYSPVLMVVSLVLAVVMSPVMAIIGLAFYGAGFILGSVGTYYHLRAIGYYVMGYTLRNFIEGPPPLAPAMLLSTSALGLIALFWRMYGH